MSRRADPERIARNAQVRRRLTHEAVEGSQPRSRTANLVSSSSKLNDQLRVVVLHPVKPGLQIVPQRNVRGLELDDLPSKREGDEPAPGPRLHHPANQPTTPHIHGLSLRGLRGDNLISTLIDTPALLPFTLDGDNVGTPGGDQALSARAGARAFRDRLDGVDVVLEGTRLPLAPLDGDNLVQLRHGALDGGKLRVHELDGSNQLVRGAA
mmetsp:Transcript_57807/g.187839  ORF Transcript_57807/g.187839 Transcript_57807/m.187839 type:complete len:210 (+) Transcript_57807:38-667(+)|eukprot:CAMPEP_0204195930 /NCGR_PEP_ID=MMETSP0361-20130328/63457_1 /ASSEMBLY_ACC=CAM_ASM_000343 /TAXON_ID=268821 /ORGANISM="Scrippsiella Hangoei, Strain SHTV-5" /LENGTH=209 /DNA_ID=CAMNT_0051157601 /DNA_START=22 /DNA_END=651 /DNA_ORIENTATION=-